jgi:hypothetical protein
MGTSGIARARKAHPALFVDDPDFLVARFAEVALR